MNTMMTTKPKLNAEALRLIDLCRSTGGFVADSRAAVACDVPMRNLVQTLDHAVEAGALVRVRHASGVMGYRLPHDEASEGAADGRNGAATAQTHAQQYQRSHDAEKTPVERSTASTISGKPTARGSAGRFAALPELDLSKIAVKMTPKHDGRAHAQRSKWAKLFDQLADFDPDGLNLPTIELPPQYGGAIGAAAPEWNKARKDGKRIRVSRTKKATIVQIERREG